MRRRLVSVALAATLVVALMTATIPEVGAQVQQAQQVIVGVVTAGASKIVSFGTLPPPFDKFSTGSGPVSVAVSGIVSAHNTGGVSDESGEEVYQSGDQFLVVKRTEADAGSSLPDGKPTTVNGHPGILRTGLSGEYRQVLPPPDGGAGTSVKADAPRPSAQLVTTAEGDPNSGAVPAEPPAPIVVKYTNANQLVWITGGVRYEALSNLSVEDLLKALAELPSVK